MKRLIQTTIALSLAAFVTGCATPFMVDRGHDALDVFTATVGIGGGVKARVGPIQTGIFANTEGFGLRGGYIGDQQGGDDSLWTVDLDCLVWSAESYGPTKLRARAKGVSAGGYCFISVPRGDPYYKEYHPIFGRYNAPYYTQLELAVGLGPTVRLGFNPGELLDFILGWTTIDIYNDDLETRKKQKEQSNSSTQATDKTTLNR